MIPGTYEFMCMQGGTFSVPLKYQNSDGSTIDLTGFTALMRVRRCSDNSLLAELSTANSRITIVGGTAADLSNIVLFIDAATTAGFTADPCKYDLELTAADGVTVNFILRGPFTVVPEVSY